jgi:hypothetical protein
MGKPLRCRNGSSAFGNSYKPLGLSESLWASTDADYRTELLRASARSVRTLCQLTLSMAQWLNGASPTHRRGRQIRACSRRKEPQGALIRWTVSGARISPSPRLRAKDRMSADSEVRFSIGLSMLRPSRPCDKGPIIAGNLVGKRVGQRTS